MRLEDIRDYVSSLNISEHVYMGKMDHKNDCSIGVYHSKGTRPYRTSIGGPELKSYGIKEVSILIHWNKSPRDTENVSWRLFEELRDARNVVVNNKNIKFIQLLVDEPVNVDTDENGIYEMVIEAAVVYGK